MTIPITALGFKLIEIEQPGRTTLDITENKTASCVPKEYFKEEADLTLPVSKLYKRILPNLDEHQNYLLACRFKPLIKDHFETRIQIFFTQLLTVHGMAIHTIKDKAYSQAGIKNKGKALANANGFKKGPNMPVEAHSSTLATLLAVSKTDWMKSFMDDDIPLESIVLGYGSSIEEMFNLTMTLPWFVNNTDMILDQMCRPVACARMTFRETCVELLKISSSEIADPVNALKIFLQKAKRYLIAIENRSACGPLTKKVVKIYRKVADAYLAHLPRKAFVRKLTYSQDTLAMKNQLIHRIMKEVQARRIMDQMELILPKITREKRILAKMVLLASISSEKSKALHAASSTVGETARKYIETLLSNENFKEEAVEYLKDHSIQEISQHLSAGIGEAPLSDLISTMLEELNKNPLNQKAILVQTLFWLSVGLEETSADGVRIRKYLHLNDAWLEEQLKNQRSLRHRTLNQSKTASVQEKVEQILAIL